MDSVYVRLLVEFIGTFVFLSIIMRTDSTPIAIAVGLLAAMYFGGSVSGGHFNPAVTLAKLVEGTTSTLTSQTALGYVGAQAAGALAAMWLYNHVLKSVYVDTI